MAHRQPIEQTSASYRLQWRRPRLQDHAEMRHPTTGQYRHRRRRVTRGIGADPAGGFAGGLEQGATVELPLGHRRHQVAVLDRIGQLRVIRAAASKSARTPSTTSAAGA